MKGNFNPMRSDCSTLFRRAACLATVSVFLALHVKAAAPPQTNAPSRLDFTSFTIISDRNIFNPNRSARSRGGEPAPPAPRVPTVESFTLVGTMSYEKGQFAFFDGTGAQFKQALKPGDAIAGFTLSGISTNQVKLKSGEMELEFPLGMQLRREDQGEWKLTARTETYVSASAPATDTSTNAPGTPASSETDSLLERLRKKREQELKDK